MGEGVLSALPTKALPTKDRMLSDNEIYLEEAYRQIRILETALSRPASGVEFTSVYQSNTEFTVTVRSFGK